MILKHNDPVPELIVLFVESMLNGGCVIQTWTLASFVTAGALGDKHTLSCHVSEITKVHMFW